ncbi:MAG: energy-coupling factor transporter transmembrane component T [Methanobacteriaceae archaeon]|nr:energy-coupling factor transporter transmembrane component T [Methanobacteriaceae archaeon]
MILESLFSPFTVDHQEEDSFIYRLDPRTKLGLLVGVTILSVYMNNLIWLLGLELVLISLTIISGTLRNMARFLFLFFLFGALAVGLLALITGNLNYSLESFSPFFARFGIMITAGLLFAFTTSPNNLARALEKMYFPPPLSFTLTITLRYIPTLAREAESIRNALKLRGISLSAWDILRKPSYFYRGMIIPLLIRTLKLSDEIAIAAESRGFNGGEGRSSLNTIKMGKNDLTFTLVMTTSCLILFLMDKTSFLTFKIPMGA